MQLYCRLPAIVHLSDPKADFSAIKDHKIFRMKFNISPGATFVCLIFFTVFLLLGNIAVNIMKFSVGTDGSLLFIYKFFDFKNEKSLPTIFSFLLIFWAALTLLLIGIKEYSERRKYYFWYGMAFIFLFLSIDEVVEIHEKFNGATRHFTNTTGVFYFDWIIPYGVFFIVFSVVCLRFLRRLPVKTRQLFILSGALFITGAIGFESLGGYHIEKHGEENTVYFILYTLEELFEMIGMGTFIYSLHCFIIDQFTFLEIIITKRTG